jgi:hypothetical protein
MDLLNLLELELVDLAVGAIIGMLGGKGCKSLILRTFPKTAPVFSIFDKGQKEMSQVIDAASANMNKNEDLRKWALKKGLKIAANLIKK